MTLVSRKARLIVTQPLEGAPVKYPEANANDGEPVTSNTNLPPARTPPNPIVDYKSAMIRLAGDQQLFMEFVAIAQEDGPELIRKIQLAIQNADCDQLQHYGHALKGLVSNFGASECVAHALAIEQAGRARNLDDVSESFEKLVVSHQELQGALDSFAENEAE